jgi:hypothetical protein
LEDQRALLELQRHDSAVDRLNARRSSLPEDACPAELPSGLAAVDQLAAERRGSLATLQRDQARPEDEIDMLIRKARSEEDRAASGKVTSSRELKGVRIELAPRELTAGKATLVRRDTRDKTPVPIDAVGRATGELLEELQRGLHAESLADREAHTYPVDDLGEFRERVGGGGSSGWPVRLGGLRGGPRGGTGAAIRVILEGQAPDGPCLVNGARPPTPCWWRGPSLGLASAFVSVLTRLDAEDARAS